MAGPPKAQVPYASIYLPDVPTGAKGAPLEVAISNHPGTCGNGSGCRASGSAASWLSNPRRQC